MEIFEAFFICLEAFFRHPLMFLLFVACIFGGMWIFGVL